MSTVINDETALANIASNLARLTEEKKTTDQELADATTGVHFLGRLGTYKYYNMDQVVAQALTLSAKLIAARGRATVTAA